jgi:hypothetical protein
MSISSSLVLSLFGVSVIGVRSQHNPVTIPAVDLVLGASWAPPRSFEKCIEGKRIANQLGCNWSYRLVKQQVLELGQGKLLNQGRGEDNYGIYYNAAPYILKYR